LGGRPLVSRLRRGEEGAVSLLIAHMLGLRA